VIAQRYSLEQPFEPLRFTKSDKEGFPTIIHGFKGYLRGTPNEKRAALTILYQYRALYLQPKIDTSSITEAPKFGFGYQGFKKD
jgi:hypothetical protein